MDTCSTLTICGEIERIRDEDCQVNALRLTKQ